MPSMSALKEKKYEREDDSLPEYEEAENADLEQDAVFGEITGDGPNYRNVRPSHTCPKGEQPATSFSHI